MESWFRLYTGICADPKLRRLPVSQRWAWVVILALAKESPQPGRLLLCEGLPLQPSDLADQANITLREAEAALASFLRQGMLAEEDGIYGVVHWAKRQYLSDRSSERVRRFRQKEAAQGSTTTSPPAAVAKVEDTPPVPACDCPSSTPDETVMKRFRNVSETPPEYRVQRKEKETPSPLNTGGPPRADEPGADSSSPELFGDFWQAYPRRLAKEAACKAWRARLRAGVDPPMLVRCAVAYAEECRRLQTPARFILHPATFLGPTLRYLDYQEPGILERSIDHESRGPRVGELVPSDAIDRRNSGDDLNLLFLA